MIRILVALFSLVGAVALADPSGGMRPKIDLSAVPKAVMTERSGKQSVHHGFPYMMGRRMLIYWTLKTMPVNRMLAVTGGPGNVRAVGIFCLSGVPILALNLDNRPNRETVEVEFIFPDALLQTTAYHEPRLYDAHFIDLRESALADLLTENEESVSIRIDGVDQGSLPLARSRGAIRTALSVCRT